MTPNLRRYPADSDQIERVLILDDSLTNDGYQPGDLATVQQGEPEPGFLEVWELDGGLHARHLQSTGNGWTQACTSFGTGGRICHSLSPETNKRIFRLGWIPRRIDSALPKPPS